MQSALLSIVNVLILIFFSRQCYGLGQFVYLRNRGMLRGDVLNVDDTKVYYFGQIRYGNARRYELPTPEVSRWNIIRRNPSTRNVCPQMVEPGANPPLTVTEDCLFLNIWTPSNMKYLSKLPVIVFIHGGIFFFGSIQQEELDARILAARTNSIVVTINYRLGSFGFLSPAQSQPNVFPNLGLHDQLLALQFVQDHIHAFGGDPNHVTVMGYSAGAMSIGAMLISPLVRERRLFRRAIMTSGAPNTVFAVDTLASGVAKTDELIRLVGCNTSPNPVQCLRDTPMNQLIVAQSQMGQELRFFTPVFGDSLLPLSPVQLLNNLNLNPQESLAGKSNITDLAIEEFDDDLNVDLLWGLSLNEGTTALQLLPSVLPPNVVDFNTAAFYVGLMIQVFRIPTTPQNILGEYLPGVNQSDSWEMAQMLASIYADLNINCPVLYFAERYHFGQDSHTIYGYLLKQKTAIEYGVCPESFGICHTSEIPFIFGLPLRPPPPTYPEVDKILSRDFIQSIKEFVYRGRINSISNTRWNQVFSRLDLETMDLKAGEYRMAKNIFIDRCRNFWYPLLFV